MPLCCWSISAARWPHSKGMYMQMRIAKYHWGGGREKQSLHLTNHGERRRDGGYIEVYAKLREYREGRVTNEHMHLITQGLMGTVDAHTGLSRATGVGGGSVFRGTLRPLWESGMNSATQGQQKALKRKPSGSCYCLLWSMQREKESERKSVRFCLPVCARLKPP